MKKILIIGLIVALALIVVGGAGVAFARIRGTDNNAGLTLTRYAYGDEVVRLYSYGPGSMMRGYAYENCPGGGLQGYGPGRVMGGYAYGSCPGGMMGGRGNASGPGMMGRRGAGG